MTGPMPALHALLADVSSLLWIDTASARTHVGLLRTDQPATWSHGDDEAGTVLFHATEEVLTQTNLRLEEVQAFVFCDGPGSILGVRTAAVALRTWCALTPRPVFAYNALALLAAAQRAQGLSGPRTYVADARRDSWHRLTWEASGEFGPLLRTPTADLPSPVYMVEGFRHWSRPPAQHELVPYSLPDYVAATASVDLLRATDQPDAFLHEEPSYQTWQPQIHRPPASS